jgi:5-formaminoimidazole-4-carboxamide-1-beta-D-ribofuranosyl 5'-monophosphate synthetase
MSQKILDNYHIVILSGSLVLFLVNQNASRHKRLPIPVIGNRHMDRWPIAPHESEQRRQGHGH